MSNKHVDKAIIAMKLLVEWQRLRNMCIARESCSNCPYFCLKNCEMISTDAVIERTSNAFKDFLDHIEAIERG